MISMPLICIQNLFDCSIIESNKINMSAELDLLEFNQVETRNSLNTTNVQAQAVLGLALELALKLKARAQLYLATPSFSDHLE